MPLSPHTRTRLLFRDGKRVRAHRWIMEQHLGRKLHKWEHVHHINGDPLDNRLENLEVLHEATHLRLHKQIYPDKKSCAVCKTEFLVNPRKRARAQACSPDCRIALVVWARTMARGGVASNRGGRRKIAPACAVPIFQRIEELERLTHNKEGE